MQRRKLGMLAAILLCTSAAQGNDVRKVTQEQVTSMTENTFCGNDSWLSKTRPLIGQLSDGADSLFADQINKDFASLEGDCAKVCKNQDALSELLKTPAGPARSRAVIIAWTRLIRDLEQVRAQAAVMTAKLRAYFKATRDEKPFDQISQFSREPAHLAELHQGLLERFILENVN